MNERIVALILARPGHGLSAEDQAVLRRMADHFDRASLRIVADDGAPGAALELVFSDDAVRYAVTVAELRALHDDLARGVAVAWGSLRRAPRR